MPNWCSCNAEVIIETENLQKFLSMFNNWNGGDNNKDYEHMFYRTFYDGIDSNILLGLDKNGKNISKITMYFQCAWSFYTCLILEKKSKPINI